jgi:hypothetical protein
MVDRSSAQTVVRVAALAFVVAWLFVRPLQDAVPFWLPFAALLAAEVEFVVRGVRERRAGAATVPDDALSDRRRPTEADADLGWGELVELDDDIVYVPPPRRASRSRSRRLVPTGLAIAAAVLFVLAARVDRTESWSALPEKTRTRAEATFSAEASRIAGAPVSVRCDDGYAFTGIGSDALGVAFIRSGLAFLRPDVCRRLVAIAIDGDHRDRDDSARALLVLAHEAVHLKGERDEGVTECHGLQEAVALGERLGLERDTAHRMMDGLYASIAGERSITRLAYRLPPDCRDGGALDLRPGDPVFP